jgi:hypothetical protein
MSFSLINMKINRINQHKSHNIIVGNQALNKDFDYLAIHQEWHLGEYDGYLAFYIVLLGFGLEIVV